MDNIRRTQLVRQLSTLTLLLKYDIPQHNGDASLMSLGSTKCSLERFNVFVISG